MTEPANLPPPPARLLPDPPRGFPGGYVPIVGRVVDDVVVPGRPADIEGGDA
ncbi:hypothetical protein [Phenylobacterium ferrooxidans]|uniref:Uncharacterized protein n=1 Tax=Phenylobacterium ferrooxidans TaxID=2982689 RepID=A0ABW6CJR3_9CAUL